jgi:Calpain family cysteine protease/Fibronectin type III domain
MNLFSSLRASFNRTANRRVFDKRHTRLGVESLEGRALPSTTVPAAPVLTTTAVSSSQVNLTWKAVSSATSYEIDVYKNGAWATPVVVGNLTSYPVAGLTPGAAYTFRVASLNAAGGTWSYNQNAVTAYEPATSAVNDPYLPAPTYSAAPASVPLFGSAGPKAIDVTQGYEGDCWFIASLAATAAQAPQDIVNMFTYYGSSVENGVTVQLYTVRIYNNAGAAQYVTVDTELPSGGTYYDRLTNPTGTSCLWVALAEKAYAEANGLGYVTSQHTRVDSYDALSGGYPQWAVQAITGKSAAGYSFSAANLASEWNAGDIIVLTSTANPSNPYIVPDHAYAVVGYNGSTFTVLNPWGTDKNGTAPSKNTNGQLAYGQLSGTAAALASIFSSTALGTRATPNQFGPAHVAASHLSESTPATTNVTGSQTAATAASFDHAFRIAFDPMLDLTAAHPLRSVWEFADVFPEVEALAVLQARTGDETN